MKIRKNLMVFIIFAASVLSWPFHAGAAVLPTPDIKANGSDDPVSIAASENLSATIALDPGDYPGVQADWWCVADTPSGWYYYNINGTWRPGFKVSYQAPLGDLSPPLEVLNMSGLPTGSYTLYFGVDLNRNGNFDEPSYYDSVEVSITSPLKPNIVIFISDDMGWGDSMVYNQDSKIPMPNLDRLAEEGMVFTNAYTSASICAPTRYSAMTGNYQWRGLYPEGQWDYKGGSQILEGQWTLADVVKTKGYHTAIFGKLHLGGDFYLKNSNEFADLQHTDSQIDFARGLINGPIDHGFDYSYILLRGIQKPPYAYFENDQLVGNPQDLIVWEVGTYGNSEITSGGRGLGVPDWNSSEVGPTSVQKAVEFIDQHHQENLNNGTNIPFFLYYASQSAHRPWTPPVSLNGEPVEGVTGMTPHTDMVHEIDVALGVIIDEIETRGLMANTLIIFTSDNGGIPDEISYGHDAVGGLRGEKETIWEGGHRVPFIAKWGDGTLQGSIIPPNSTSDQIIGVHDLAATLAAVVGQNLPIDQARDSFNFLPVLLGDQSDDEPVRDHLIMQDFYWDLQDNRWKSQFFALRMNQWKLILDDNNNVYGLYNLADDVAESDDLMNNPNYTDLINDMRNKFIQLRNSARTSPSLNPETICNNGIDDDGDGLTDCQDPDCQDSIYCTTDVILSADFNTGTDGFTYSDDTFRGSNHPAYASGDYLSSGGFSGGGLHVSMGGIDFVSITDGLSGGWTRSFTVTGDDVVSITLRYRLVFPYYYESDECGQALVAIDGTLVGPGPEDYLEAYCGTGVDQDSGWQQVTFEVALTDGPHTITVGGWNSKKTGDNEVTEVFFDDIEIQ